jgi:hypothetical protein
VDSLRRFQNLFNNITAFLLRTLVLFYGTRGVVIIRGQRGVNFANPGCFRIAFDEAVSGGVSDPMNVTIMKMFNLLDIGERAGSGIPAESQVYFLCGMAKGGLCLCMKGHSIQTGQC